MQQEQLVVAFYPCLVQQTGDHPSAVVLSQLLYWLDGRARIERDGRRWLARSRAQLCQETGITLDQYKRIMPRLAEQGWILLERHLFANKVTPFIALGERGEAFLTLKEEADHAVQSAAQATNPLEPPPTIPLVAQASNPITETLEEIYTKIGIPVNAHDTLKKLQRGSPGQNLEVLWKSRMYLVYEQKTLKPWTAKERGQGKQLKTLLGERWYPVVDWCLQHWEAFTARTTEVKGHMKAPSRPDLGYLLKYLDVAVEAQAMPAVPIGGPAVQLIATSPPQSMDTLDVSVYTSGVKPPVKTVPDEESKAMLEKLLNGG